MIDRATKLRWRRRYRRQRLQVEEAGVQAEAQIEKHFFKRLSRLAMVRRFMVSWLLLLILLTVGSVVQLLALGRHYQTLAPAPGGAFTEGIIGMFTGANPLYATSAADSAVSKLVFSGLMKYDQNNKLVGDLAESYKVDNRAVRYEVTLRPDLRWHDGEPLTSEDVVFTYKTIQNPDARSPLFGSWQDIEVSAKDDRTVVFSLPNQLGAFPHSLTNGVVPEHILADMEPDQLRSSRFNTVATVGSGPFKLEGLEVAGNSKETREERVGLTPNEYFYRSQPKLSQLIIRTFRDEDLMIQAFESGELDAMVGLADLPEELQGEDIQDFNIPLTGEVMVFFNTSEAPLDTPAVRQALVSSVDTVEASAILGYPVIAAKGPMLMSHSSYNAKLVQLTFNKAKAEQILDKAGWKKGQDGIRQKGGQRLAFTLQAQSVSDYTAISGYLRESWKAIGAEVEVSLQTEADIQAVVSSHDHQALLYGISLGPDPDVFAYWHSSQAQRGSSWLNLSEYKSKKADSSLEEGRTRSDPATRAVKYEPFLEAWGSDAPALALYQPRFYYIIRGNLFNFDTDVVNSPTDRFNNVENWMIREERVLK